MLIDTHCHLTFPQLRDDVDGVIQRAEQAGVTRLITIATDPTDAAAAVELTRRFDNVRYAAGIHPHEAGKVGEDELAALESYHTRGPGGDADRCPIAVGETGLDFHYDFAPRDVQERVFRRQVELARRVERPIIIHARESESDVCNILSDYPDLAGRVVFHCFSGDVEMARRIFDMGLWVSFTGVVTFRNAAAIQAAAKFAPADRFMVETDSPYLTPEPKRRTRPNEPAYVVWTARYLAELRGEPYDTLVQTTTANAERFFALQEDAE
jgi:TatD DNase family protein